MNWKKWLSGLVVAGCLLVGGSVAPLWASEADMIDLLLKKNVITQEEADRMTEKIKSSSQQEKAEIKKELTEDIKKDAAKGEFIPSALKGFKFGTTIYSFWEGKSYFSGDNANTNKFVLDRAYVTLTKDVNDWLGMNITADLYNDVANSATSTSTSTITTPPGGTVTTTTKTTMTDNNTSYELRFKYVYADLKLFGTSTKIGVVPTPSDAYDGSIYPYRMQGKHLLDVLGVQASADLGIVNQGVFGGYMDSDYLKYGDKSFGGKWGGYMIGLYNGAGYDYTTENNNNKTVSALVYVRPFPTVSILKGLQLAYVGTYGLSNKNFAAPAPAGSTTTDYPNWRANIVQASLVHPYFAIMGQYYWGSGLKNSTEEKKRKGYLIDGYVRIPGVEKLRVFGKYYTYDPDSDLTATSTTKKNEYSVYVAGLSYDLSKEFTPFISWERENSKEFSSRTDYNRYQIGFQLKF
jgi:polyhydroxyalkanoate synthesis regulator phasin